MKKTICWDVDDVLNNFTYRWFKHYVQEQTSKFKQIDIKYFDLIENPPHKVLQMSKEDYLDSIDHFAESHYDLLVPDFEIIDWFKLFGNKFNHVVLTACPLYRAHISFQWILLWFGTWIKSCNVVPSPRPLEIIQNKTSKAEFIERNFKQIHYFIDDNEKNCKDVELLGIKTYSINRPWNNSLMSFEDITYELVV